MKISFPKLTGAVKPVGSVWKAPTAIKGKPKGCPSCNKNR